MGNFCTAEQESEFEWKRQLQSSCKRLGNQWAQAILEFLPKLKNERNMNLRDLILMNHAFQRRKSDAQHQKNVKKFMRRTAMTEEDVASIRERSFASSYLSNTESNIYHEKACQVNSINIKSIDYFGHFTDIIKQQLRSNELGIIISIFKDNIEQDDQVMDSFIQFTQLLYSAIVLYYDIENFKFQTPEYTSLINHDTIINFVRNNLLQDQKLYDFIFKIIKNNMTDKVRFTTQYIYQNSNITWQEVNILKQFWSNHKKEPYAQAIKTLQKLEVKQGPASKAKIIIKVAQEITATMKRNCGNNNYTIQSDDILPVYKYVVIKSQLYDLDVHLEFMEKLLTQNVLSSSIGFFITTLSAVLKV